jgi:hypothetical protein
MTETTEVSFVRPRRCRSNAQLGPEYASSISLAMGLTTILTTIWVVHRNAPKCKILIFRENWTSGTSLDTLPMSGGQWVAVVDRLRLAEIGSDLRFRNGADSHEAAAKESTYA